MKVERLLIFMDAIFDTRLGVISTINPQVANDIVSVPELFKQYTSRYNDDMSKFGIDKDVFYETYARRDAFILPKSLATPMLFMIKKLLVHMDQGVINNPHLYDDFEIELNIHPYGNMSDVVKMALAETIESSLSIDRPIRIVDFPLTDLDHKKIKDREYSTIVLYDVDPWLTNYFHKDLTDEQALERSIPEVTIMTAMFFDDIKKYKAALDFKNPAGQQCPPHLGVSKLLEHFVGLKYLGVTHYCIPTPREFIAFNSMTD